MQALKDLEVSKWVFVPLTRIGFEKGCLKGCLGVS